MTTGTTAPTGAPALSTASVGEPAPTASTMPLGRAYAPRPAASLTDFCTVFPRLEAAQKELFQATVTRLLAGHILTPGSAFRPDAAWQFADRFGDLIDGYLRLAGWRLDIDRQLGIARVVHEGGEQRARLNRLESVTLCVLRLVYHEQKLVLKEDDACRTTVGEVRERLIHAGLSALDVSKRQLLQALRSLDRYHLIEVERGFDGDDAELVTVSPAVERVLSPERVETELRVITERRAARSAGPAAGVSAGASPEEGGAARRDAASANEPDGENDDADEHADDDLSDEATDDDA